MSSAVAGPLIALGLVSALQMSVTTFRNVTSDQQRTLGAECRLVGGALFAINDDWWAGRR
jgi:hypothetical protein